MIFGISRYIKLVILYFGEAGGLFLFTMVEFEKVLYSPDFKMVLIFLVTKVFQKGAKFRW